VSRDTLGWIKRLLVPPDVMTLAMRELDDAQRELLEAQSAKEYSTSMVLYHEARIRRLRAFAAADTVQPPRSALYDLTRGD
jgi:hypothetical protein